VCGELPLIHLNLSEENLCGYDSISGTLYHGKIAFSTLLCTAAMELRLYYLESTLKSTKLNGEGS
jgi:hypothetical protein